MSDSIHEVSEIRFGLYSPKEIEAIAVVKIDQSKKEGTGSVYDESLGPKLGTKKPCKSCGKSAKECPGHFGYIDLVIPLIHPLFYKNVVSYLRCICIKCNKLLITKDLLDLCDITKTKGQNRFDQILEKLMCVDLCCHCGYPQPKILYTPIDGNISKILLDKKNKLSIIMSIEEIQTALDNITDDDVRLLGFDPELIHPRNYILTKLLVIPPCDRPYVVADGGICDDDLTVQLLEIIKANNHLLDTSRSDLQHQKDYQSVKFRIATMYNNSKGKAKHTINGRPIKCIKSRISGKSGQIRNNHMGKRVNFSARTVIGAGPDLRTDEVGIPDDICENLTRPVGVNERNIKHLQNFVDDGKVNYVDRYKNDSSEFIHIVIKYVLIRKGTPLLFGDTIIRKNGEECKVVDVLEFTLREGDTVSREKSNGEYKLLIPPRIGDILIRKDERSTITDLENLIIYQDDVIERNGKPINWLVYPTNRKFNLKIGDTVHRHLQNGDPVVFNRQPTLHKASMMAKKVKRHGGKTFKMNLSTTAAYNADEHRRQQQGALKGCYSLVNSL